jgi:hypothetical protein
MYELEEAMAEFDQEIEAAPRASAFGDRLLTASQRAAEKPHDTSADTGKMHGEQDKSPQMRNTIGWIDEEASHQIQTAGQALLVDPNPFRCLWCNEKARHKSLEGFFAVFKLFEEGSRDTWRVTDIRNGRPAREAFKPRACDAHKAKLARLLVRCVQESNPAKFTLNDGKGELWVFNRWDLFKQYVGVWQRRTL